MSQSKSQLPETEISPLALGLDPEHIGALTAFYACTALALIEENERCLLAQGRNTSIAYGTWLAGPRGQGDVIDYVGPRAPRIVGGAAAERAALDFQPQSQFMQVKALGLLALGQPIERRQVLEGWHPRASLLPPLIHALASADVAAPPTAYQEVVQHLGWAGEDSNAYGVEHRAGEWAAERLTGIAACYPDRTVPVTLGIDTVGTSFDADNVEDLGSVARMLMPWRRRPARDHVDQLHGDFVALAAVRQLLMAAHRSGSPVLERLGVAPSRLLAHCSQWLVVNHLDAGMADGHLLAPRSRRLPGNDVRLLRLVLRANLRPLFRIFDTVEPLTAEAAMTNVLFVNGDHILPGHLFARALMSPDRFGRIPGLREVDGAELRQIAARTDLRDCGATHVGHGERWLYVPDLRLLDERGQYEAFSLIMRTAGDRDVAFLCRADMTRPETRGDVIARLAAACHESVERARRRCVALLVSDFDLHRPKSPAYESRMYLRLTALASNASLVAHGRSARSRETRF